MQQIIGHREAVDVLTSSLASDRLPHAWVFHGPSGVGKFHVSKLLAATLLCHSPGTPKGISTHCGACPSCVLLSDTDGGTGHPDFHIVHKELARFSSDPRIRDRKLSSIPLEVLRENLLDPVYRAPQLGKRKVLIVDEAELLSEAGQNLLLKTLEEPPAGTFIFLIASDSARLLPTVRSRCRMLSFGPIPDELVTQWLADHHAELTPQQSSWLVMFAEGSLGRLCMAIEYALYEWEADITAGLSHAVAGKYPASLGTQLAQRVADFAEQWVKAHQNASKDAANKLGAAMVLSMFARHARAAMRATADQAEGVQTEGLDLRMDPWLKVTDCLRQVEAEVRAGVNLSIALEHLVSLMYRSLRPASSPVPVA